MKSSSKRNMLIGLTVLVSICLLIWGIEYLKGVNLFKPTNYYYVSFEKVDGLAKSSPVKVNGFQVGMVRDILYDYKTNKISLELSFDKDMRIPKGSMVTMVGELLGGAYLDLTLGQAKDCYEEGSTLPSRVKGGLMDNVGDNLMPTIASILPKVDSIMGSVNSLLANPALDATVTRFDQISQQLALSSAELTLLMNHLNKSLPSVMNNVDGTMSNAAILSKDLQTTTANLNEFTGTLKELPLDSTISRINTSLAHIQSLTAQLNNQNSSLGMLLNDKQLYKNASNSIASLDSLLTDLKKHPKKYITIKVF